MDSASNVFLELNCFFEVLQTNIPHLQKGYWPDSMNREILSCTHTSSSQKLMVLLRFQWILHRMFSRTDSFVWKLYKRTFQTHRKSMTRFNELCNIAIWNSPKKKNCLKSAMWRYRIGLDPNESHVEIQFVFCQWWIWGHPRDTVRCNSDPKLCHVVRNQTNMIAMLGEPHYWPDSMNLAFTAEWPLNPTSHD